MEYRPLDPSPLYFRKMHGLGNDFVVIDARGGGDPITPARARAIGDRHRGVGFDQLAVILDDPDVTARLVFWNADGTLSDACGNATRCVASLLSADLGRGDIVLRTGRGALRCQVHNDETVSVDMGRPMLDWQQIPLSETCDTVRLPLAGAPSACSMGNPHCTFFVDNAEAVDLPRIGGQTETSPLFPERTNVQIAQIISRREARVRVWERGVGITLASGSSACAVLVNAVRRDLMDREADINLDGGTLHIRWLDTGGVQMTGPVARVFEGTLDPDLLKVSA